MITISSHILDTVSGDHARGIRVQCLKLSKKQNNLILSEPVFDIIANQEGRILESVELDGSNDNYDLIFHSKSYFESHEAISSSTLKTIQVMEVVTVRLSLTDKKPKYHVPIMLSPHSYSVWWSA
ncbi:hypothetical protein AB833_08960 [Chromatiales bacterium (ex Bugula neritina AB1)]|nr:hypothetical protein AB833_08960 [Chromatiales bacterium (ex Bugula neritina AB1)]